MVLEDLGIKIKPPYKSENVSSSDIKARDRIRKFLDKIWNNKINPLLN